MQLKIAMLGAGRIGNVHCRSIQTQITNASVKWVFDLNITAAQKLAATYNIPNFSSDISKIWADPEVDAVIVGTPTPTHLDYVYQAAKAKKHIFCEKPIDFDTTKIKTALEVVSQSGVKMQVGFNRRFDPNFWFIQKRIQQQALGRVHTVHITSRDPDLAPLEYMKDSGGLFVDMMIHDLDMAAYLVNSPICEVYAAGNLVYEPKLAQYHDVDLAMVQLRFVNGALGVIENSRKTAYGYDQRVEVFGDKGYLKAENNHDSNVIYTTSDVYNAKTLPQYFFLERYQQSYINEMIQFIDAIINNQPISATKEDGYKAVVVAKACALSLQMNQPVKVIY